MAAGALSLGERYRLVERTVVANWTYPQVVIAGSSLGQLIGAVNWGDAPTWFGAIAAAGGLVAAVIAARVARKIFLVESERDRLTEADRLGAANQAEAAQASQVAGWVAPEITSDTTWDWHLRIRNASALPVFDVSALVLKQDRERTEEPQFTHGWSFHVLAPDELADQKLEKQLGGHGRVWVVVLHFRDATGRYWYRAEDGILARSEAQDTLRMIERFRVEEPDDTG